LDTVDRLIDDVDKWPAVIKILQAYPHAAAFTFRSIEAMKPGSKVYLDISERRAECPEDGGEARKRSEQSIEWVIIMKLGGRVLKLILEQTPRKYAMCERDCHEANSLGTEASI